MLSVYNETSKPVEVVRPRDNKIFVLKKELVNSKRSLDVKVSTKVETHQLLNPNISKMINSTSDPEPIIVGSLALHFNRNNYDPLILNTFNSNKAMGIISLDMRGRKVYNMMYINSFILDYQQNGDELVLFISVNSNKYPFAITLIDENNRTDSYKFYNRNNKLELKFSSGTAINEYDMVESPEFNIFRPSKATYNILALDETYIPDEVTSKNTLVRRCSSIIDMMTQMRNLYMNKVTAITIATDGMNTFELTSILESANTLMNIIFLMDKDGNIVKHKVTKFK